MASGLNFRQAKLYSLPWGTLGALEEEQLSGGRAFGRTSAGHGAKLTWLAKLCCFGVDLGVVLIVPQLLGALWMQSRQRSVHWCPLLPCSPSCPETCVGSGQQAAACSSSGCPRAAAGQTAALAAGTGLSPCHTALGCGLTLGQGMPTKPGCWRTDDYS